jgi:hypothetical protein
MISSRRLRRENPLLYAVFTGSKNSFTVSKISHVFEPARPNFMPNDTSGKGEPTAN